MTHAQSTLLFQRATTVIPGGVNSPVRAFHGVGGNPLFIAAGNGAYLTDVDHNTYIDYVGSWGPLILGHAHPVVIEAVTKAIQRGCSFGAPTEIEVQMAEKICALMPNIEQVRFVNSGTEAAMSAIRLARGYTARNKIIKFSGCYHGHADHLLVAAGSGAMTLGVPSSHGVSAATAEQTLIAPYNHLEAVAALFAAHGDDIAAIIVEPVAANMNLVLPQADFLAGLRALCDQYGSLLILDEVITGFRLGLGGAQAHFGIRPDLTILGKIIGGGFPVGAFGGRRDIMQALAPIGPVYQAGTLSGNPIAMTAGLATLEHLESPGIYQRLATQTARLTTGLKESALKAGIPFQTNTIASLFGLFFTDAQHVTTEYDVQRCALPQFKHFFHGMLREGVYLAPSAFEIGFVSIAHTDADITKTLIASEKVFARLQVETPLLAIGQG